MRKAILCFLRKDDQVLLIYDNYPSGALWNGISGYIEDGEIPEEAVIREIKEEINLDIKIDDLTHLGTHEVFDIFECYKWVGNPKALEEGITDIKWFDIADIPYGNMHKGNETWLPTLLN